MFSHLTHTFGRAKNPLYTALAELRQKGEDVLDLVSGNPTSNGIQFPPEILTRVLSESAVATRRYLPDPLGSMAARQAVVAMYDQPGLRPDQLMLTPGTSLSYWYLFKLLANPGDDLLVPRPTYPLFEEIAHVADIRLQYYRLQPRERWFIDIQQMEDHISERTKGIVLVTPHNPTGAVATRAEWEAIADLATRRNLPVIVDEVFSPFTFDGAPFYRPFDRAFPLLFTLNGFSKMFALAGIKLGWILVTGDPGRAAQAIRGLEHLSDLFLPVNEQVQACVQDLLREGPPFAASYQGIVRQRRDAALTALKASNAFTWIGPEGGFYLPLKMCRTDRNEDEVALHVLKESRILIHPGHFYGLPPGYLVMSYLSEPAALASAIQNLEGTCR